jgi:hypothetical protein
VPLSKFVDDVTAIECVTNDAYSQMQIVNDQIADWSDRNFMSVNSRKSKEMIFGSLKNDQPAPLVLRTGAIEVVPEVDMGLFSETQPNPTHHVMNPTQPDPPQQFKSQPSPTQPVATTGSCFTKPGKLLRITTNSNKK